MKHLISFFAQMVPEDQLEIPKTDLTNTTVTDSIQAFLGMAAAVAVLVIAISAFRIVLSRGNSQDLAKARDAIVYAVIGLVITMIAFSIVTFVVERV